MCFLDWQQSAVCLCRVSIRYVSSLRQTCALQSAASDLAGWLRDEGAVCKAEALLAYSFVVTPPLLLDTRGKTSTYRLPSF